MTSYDHYVMIVYVYMCICFYENSGYRLTVMVCLAPCDPRLVPQQIIGYKFCPSIKTPENACLLLIWNQYSCCVNEMMKWISFSFPQLFIALISTHVNHVEYSRSDSSCLFCFFTE